ncbi:hypothetical protein FRACYDRAFT_254533 [Fragilariopsis cylindrus CCMP1102]|uniref:Uncharacterized protein n=1 Tax=Fragilariopsis cylindrus CCMP1102 TaxID=635003 RepID=A0A1E7ELS3_9STRA|nr:hypothetical protein FRACYDRAFT_254533 [Fragilariopsis cylindrus CCMP1102]|eukprot:OEU06513.1 hypothetical protein FRACYDRAFT_254533 [Fragilariopsis cylindrus CCMP1102]
MCRCCLIILLLCRLEITGVSAWAPTRAPLPLRQSYRNGNGNSNGIATTGTVSAELFVSSSPKRSTLLYSTTIEDTDTSIKTIPVTLDTDTPSVAPQQHISSGRRIMSMPSIHYTVPGIKRGWKNLDTGVWMDVDGPRNGPPQNYWRQQSDEKLYKDSMQLVQELLQLNQNNDLIDGLVQPFEFENSIRRPFLNRLILGDWAPIVRNGEVIADNGKGSSSSSTSTTTSIVYSNEITVPYCFQIQRTAGQKLAPKTHYGTFDQHLEPEEEITIQQLVAVAVADTTTTTTTESPSSSSPSSSIDGSNTIVTTASGVVKVSSDNEHRLVKGFDGLCMGGITYISKYIMIMRREDKNDSNAGGPLIEIWMRVDPDV